MYEKNACTDRRSADNEFLDEVSELDSLAFVKERGFFQPGSVNVIIHRRSCFRVAIMQIGAGLYADAFVLHLFRRIFNKRCVRIGLIGRMIDNTIRTAGKGPDAVVHDIVHLFGTLRFWESDIQWRLLRHWGCPDHQWQSA